MRELATRTVFEFLKTKMVRGRAYTSTKIQSMLIKEFSLEKEFASHKVRNIAKLGVIHKSEKVRGYEGFSYIINFNFNPTRKPSPFKGMAAPKRKKKYADIVCYLTSAGEFLFEMAKMNGVKQ